MSDEIKFKFQEDLKDKDGNALKLIPKSTQAQGDF